MKHFKQRGFSALGALLLIVIVGILAGTGWSVWQAKQDADNTLLVTKTDEDSTDTVDPNNLGAASSANWLEYTSPSEAYSIKLADGWSIERYQKSESLYAFGTEHLTYKPGVRAVVTEVAGGRDGTGIGIHINYSETLPSDTPMGTVLGEKTNDAGVKITHYKYVELSGENEGLGGLPKGAVQHTFVATKLGKSIVVAYGTEHSTNDASNIIGLVADSVKFL